MMRRMAGRLPVRITALAAVAFFLIVVGRAAGSGVPTIHPTWLWTDLKPIGDGDISYMTCDPYLPASPNWSYGVENWDAAMGGLMGFDQYGCSWVEPPLVQMRYEDPEDPDYQCLDFVYGCWTFPEKYVPPPWQVGIILFDYDIYSSYNNTKKTAAAAHEWGHIMDLASVTQQNCTQPWRIMGGNENGACILGPSWMEAWTVADLHGWSDLDSDGDGFEVSGVLFFSDAAELYMGTYPDDDCGYSAWPLDIDNNQLITIGDVFIGFAGRLGQYEGSDGYSRRSDLDATGGITIADVYLYKGRFNLRCS
jgi:hypothetical protein